MRAGICILDTSARGPGEDDGLAARLAARLRLPAHRRAHRLVLESTFEPARSQYDATALLRQVVALPHEPGEKLIAVVNVDLFIPVLTYVFGQAQLGGHAAILSTCRLAGEFYGLPTDPVLLRERVEKEVFHELGHLFGLYHCRQFECVMRSSTDVEDVDLKRSAYCRDCEAAIARAVAEARGAP